MSDDDWREFVALTATKFRSRMTPGGTRTKAEAFLDPQTGSIMFREVDPTGHYKSRAAHILPKELEGLTRDPAVTLIKSKWDEVERTPWEEVACASAS